MRLGIVCSSAGNLGHAAVARELAKRALGHGSLKRLVFISDQSEVLRQWSFFGKEAELLALGRDPVPPLDLLLLDAIPFRRASVLDGLLASLSTPSPKIVAGHVGWGATLPGATAEQVAEWFRLLRLLHVSNVLVYHPIEVCGGECDVSRLASRLEISVVHSGMLYPQQGPVMERRAKAFVGVSGGGAQSGVVLSRARELLARLPDWECDFVAGPYADDVPGENQRIRVLRGVTDVGSRLRSYQFSITRAGYSACCEHIAAGVPTIMVPIEHPEQRANAVWARRYLPSVQVDELGGIDVQPASSPKPTAFTWEHTAGLAAGLL